jgi:drug/metabolite transporter (DMT)-like permease
VTEPDGRRQASTAGEADVEGNPRGGGEAFPSVAGRRAGTCPGAAGFWQTGTGVACALASGVCFSVSTVCAQKAIGAGLPVAVVAGSRPVIGATFLFAVTAVTGRQAIAGRARLRLMGVGLFTAAQIFLLYQSVDRIAAPLAVLLLYTYPALVAVLSLLVLRERLGPVKIAALAASLAGVLLIVGLPGRRVTLAGVAFGLGAGLSLAVYIVLAAAATRGIKPLTAVSWIQLGAAIAYLPALAFTPRMGTPGLGWLVPVGLGAGAATALFLTSVHRLGATTASIAATIEPISTAALSAVLLGVTLTAAQAYGGLLIVAALVLVSLDGARRRSTTMTAQ